MAKATPSTYRILTHRQRLRRGWHTQTISNTHRVGYDPTVYEGVIFLGTAPEPDRWPFLDIVSTSHGDLGLVRAAS